VLSFLPLHHLLTSPLFSPFFYLLPFTLFCFLASSPILSSAPLLSLVSLCSVLFSCAFFSPSLVSLPPCLILSSRISSFFCSLHLCVRMLLIHWTGHVTAGVRFVSRSHVTNLHALFSVMLLYVFQVPCGIFDAEH
jgi:hypothetical protein